MDIFDLASNQNNDVNDEDIFSCSVNLEESHIKDGYKDGYIDGLYLGRQEGYDVGLKHGFESGEELGLYCGLIDVWTSVVRVEPSYFPARVQKSIQQMGKLLEKSPYLNHEDESKDAILNELRKNFKATCGTLKVKLQYKGYPKLSDPYDY